MRSKNKLREILGYINIVEDKLLLNKNKILTNVFKFFFITLPLKEYLYSVPEFYFERKSCTHLPNLPCRLTLVRPCEYLPDYCCYHPKMLTKYGK